ncbi:hypothetical protein PybrP1_005044 [[Pythium] brassicae (nom. inval.)]|nr:hypothetical protein PybrP1_005044 [[Pythium] brassicae (nom. inval.)]
MGGDSKLTKNQRRRLKKKLEKHVASSSAAPPAVASASTPVEESSPADVAVEYVSLDVKQELANAEDDPAYAELLRVFGTFSSAEELCGQPGAAASGDAGAADKDAKARGSDHHTDDADENPPSSAEDEDEKALSKKARKKLKRLSVAELKQLVAFPDVVEAHDVTSADPRLLVFLKSYRNTVPVPRHWSHKRKYLQGKRGVEKLPFLLPEFIARTGIAEVRGAVAEDDDKKKAKSRARERVQPKMNRIDIDYQVLHDAFFRYQTKPKLTILGDLYYEGKEFEVKVKAKVPGQLSDELKRALGMVDGVPPPWLLSMQRYGPPPAYPNLKIPGLNAPIPEGASFGYHPGGWGKPPVDEDTTTETINRERWGELEEVEEGAGDEEEEDEEERDDEGDDAGRDAELRAALDATGTETPLADGISSVASGLSTPGGIVDMRKGIRGSETPDTPQQLYTVLEQKETSVGTSLYGSGHAYVVPGASDGARSVTGRVRRRFEDVAPDDAAAAAPPADADADDDDAKKSKKKAKTEKSKKLKDFKF